MILLCRLVLLVPLPCFVDVFNLHVGSESCCFEFFSERFPISADDAVVCYYRMKDTVVAMCSMAMFGRKRNVAAFPCVSDARKMNLWKRWDYRQAEENKFEG